MIPVLPGGEGQLHQTVTIEVYQTIPHSLEHLSGLGLHGNDDGTRLEICIVLYTYLPMYVHSVLKLQYQLYYTA